MVQIKLNRLLKKDLSPLVETMLKAIAPVAGIYDMDGNLLLGTAQAPNTQHPITASEDIIGWVAGEQASVMAQLLSELVSQVLEKKALANEVLDKYREINLLYNLAEKLTSCWALTDVAKVALEEAQRLITATRADLFILKPDSQILQSLTILEPLSNYPGEIPAGEGIVGSVVITGKPELVNQVATDPRHHPSHAPVQSMLCAPLKTTDRVIGVITIHSEQAMNYTAADLKLLAAIAAQTTPAIESALFHQQQMEAAQQREDKLKEELLELKIEIDQVKRAKQVAEITESDYFQFIQQRAKVYRDRAQQNRTES